MFSYLQVIFTSTFKCIETIACMYNTLFQRPQFMEFDISVNNLEFFPNFIAGWFY